MKTMIKRTLAILAIVAVGSTAANAQSNFAKDVNDTIDAALGYIRTTFWTPALDIGGLEEAHGLLGLAILEKHASADFSAPILGYVNSSVADQTRLRNLTREIINNSNHVSRSYFYAYVDGIDMMYLSLYARTGGPEPVGATMTVRAAIDALVDRTLDNQTSPTQCCGTNGMWGYTSPGDDSSTTQFAVGGLAASLGYYFDAGLGGDPGARIPLINASLIAARQAYVDNQTGNSGYPEATFGAGWGYRVPGYEGSYPQTASGMWVTELGGANLNAAAVQKALKWQRTRYHYEDINQWDGGWYYYSYGYYLFSSSKAYALLEEQGVPPSPGNLTTNDLGTLPADPAMHRLLQRNPAVNPCARVNFPGACNGSYASEPKRWYYDYAYTIMSYQNANGSFALPTNPFGTWDGGAGASDQAYRVLVLERSLAGACVDSDGDGFCDTEDNCPQVSNPDQNPLACNAAPVCTAAAASIQTLWPANGAMENVSIVGVTDPNGDALTITYNSVRSDESSSLAAPAPDAVTLPGGIVSLRKQRGVSATNPGNGRVYYLSFTAKDPAQASCSGIVQVNVPRTLATGAISEGSNFDVTLP